MQISIDNQNFRDQILSQEIDSLNCIYGLAFGMIYDNKFLLNDFQKLKQNFVLEKKNQQEIILKITEQLNLTQKITIGNQQCLGLIINQKDDKSQRQNEMLLSIILPIISKKVQQFDNDFVIITNNNGSIKTLYYSFKNELLTQQSNTMNSVKKQLKIIHGKIQINEQLKEINNENGVESVGENWDISINNMLVKKESEKIEQVIGKDDENECYFQIHLKNDNMNRRTIKNDMHILRGEIQIYLLVSSKMTIQQLKELIRQEASRQLTKHYQQAEYNDLQKIKNIHQQHYLRQKSVYMLNQQHIQSENRFFQELQQTIEGKGILIKETDKQDGHDAYYKSVDGMFEEAKEKRQEKMRQQEQVIEKQKRLQEENQQAMKERYMTEVLKQKEVQQEKVVGESFGDAAEFEEQREGKQSLMIFSGIVVLLISCVYYRLNYI